MKSLLSLYLLALTLIAMFLATCGTYETYEAIADIVISSSEVHVGDTLSLDGSSSVGDKFEWKKDGTTIDSCDTKEVCELTMDSEGRFEIKLTVTMTADAATKAASTDESSVFIDVKPKGKFREDPNIEDVEKLEIPGGLENLDDLLKDREWSNGDALASTASTSISEAPALAVAPSGDAIIVWTVTESSKENLYWNRYDAEDEDWGTPALLETEDNTLEKIFDIAMDADGNAMVIWVQEDSGGDPDLYSRYYTASSESWAGAEVVDSADDPITEAKVGMDQDGKAFAIWSQGASASETVYGRRYAGGSWSGTTKQLQSSSGDGTDIQLAVHPAGRAIAVWVNSEQIYAQSFNIITKAWESAQIQLTQSGSEQGQSPDVAFSYDGTAAVVWTQETTSGSIQRIHTSRFNGSAWDEDNWSTPVIIDDHEDENGLTPKVIADANGNVTVVWVRDELTNSIYANRYENGSWSASDMVKIGSDGNGDAEDPVLGIDALGSVMVIWTQDNGTLSSIKSKRYHNIDKKWKTSKLVESNDGDSGTKPAIGFASNGDGICVFQSDDGGTNLIMSSFYQ